ncbi:MAG TPA: uroporphyrinogen-III synthase [Stellaceae bacterium]|jgi:uroporphyrinogen-III synthase
MKALVTRPRDDAATVAAALTARGIEPILAPLLHIEPEPDGTARLGGALAGVQALLFTSANGVRAFAQASHRFELPAYCVGEASAAAARIAGFRAVASADGNVADLAELAAARLAPGNGALLHVAASVVAGDLAGALETKDFTVRRVALYRAVEAKRFPDEIAALLRAGEVALALFFSPRTAELFVRLARAAGLTEHCGKMIAICLSQNVAAALEGVRWRRIAVARAPTLDALLAVLDETMAA